MLVKKFTRKIDYLQYSYGVPMPWRRGVSADLISPEFEAIWENVFVFSNNELENESLVTQF